MLTYTHTHTHTHTYTYIRKNINFYCDFYSAQTFHKKTELSSAKALSYMKFEAILEKIFILKYKAEEPSLTYYLSIAGRRIMGFIAFPRVLVHCEMLSVSSRIWTHVAVSISYDDNHYTRVISRVCVCVCIYIYIYKREKWNELDKYVEKINGINIYTLKFAYIQSILFR